MEQRAQVAFEYLVILALVVVIVGTVIYILVSSGSDKSVGSGISSLRDMINDSL